MLDYAILHFLRGQKTLCEIIRQMCPKFTYKSSNFMTSKRPENTPVFNSDSSGKEKDSETGYHYFGARYYNSDLSLWLSVDPMSDKYPSLSPYNYCAWNPLKIVDPDGMDVSDHIDEKGYLIVHYDDGDNSVYVHKNGTSLLQINNQREILGNTGGLGTYIGELGGEIDITNVMENKLNESSAIASSFQGKGKYSSYYGYVHQDSDWDLKNNKQTVWGIAWEYDHRNGTSTSFSCDRFSNANAADVGNYHAGYTGVKAGINWYFLCKGAGLAETVKSFRNGKIFDGLLRANSLLTPLNLRSGDRKRDYYFNRMGMRDAKKSMK